MEIKFESSDNMYAFINNMNGRKEDLRFVFDLEPKCTNRSSKVQFKNIRLKISKSYCGNHPAMCEVTGTKPRMGKFLEGADWVGFNDLLNNICDELVISCKINSAVCEIRKGYFRRINYDYTSHDNGYRQDNRWDKFGDEKDYANGCYMAPYTSTFPDGTPGLATFLA